MKTSISLAAAPSRSSRIVEAERGATISVMELTCGTRLQLEIGALVHPRYPRQQIIDFGLRGRRDRRAGLALSAGGDDPPLLQQVFAHGKTCARLLLVTNERQVRIEQIMRGIAFAVLREAHDIDQEFRESIARHGAVGTPLHLEIQKQPAIAAEDRERPQRTVL